MTTRTSENSYFYDQNNSFARASRFSVHFFDLQCTTTTYYLHRRRFIEDVSERQRTYVDECSSLFFNLHEVLKNSLQQTLTGSNRLDKVWNDPNSLFSDVVTAVVVALSSLVTSSSKRSRRRFELKTKTRRKIEKHELLRLTVKLKLKGRIFSDNSNRQLKNPIIDSYTNWPRQ